MKNATILSPLEDLLNVMDARANVDIFIQLKAPAEEYDSKDQITFDDII